MIKYLAKYMYINTDTFFLFKSLYCAVGNMALIQQIVIQNTLTAKCINQNRGGGGSDFPKGEQ